MIYNFSPSELDFKTKCNRCFYLLKKEKISVKDNPPPVFSTFDVKQKEYFINKNSNEITKHLPKGKILRNLPGKIRSSELLDDKGRKYTLGGNPDIVLEFDTKTFGIIDFKTTNLSDTKSDNYKYQLEAYAQIFQTPSPKTPKLTPVTHMGVFQFCPTHITEHNPEGCSINLATQYASQKRIEPEFKAHITKLIDLLEGDEPELNSDCKYCSFLFQQLKQTKIVSMINKINK